MNQVIQIKRISGNVGIETVLKLRGALGVEDHGAIITTGGFTNQAVKEAERDQRIKINLVNGHQLVEMILEHFEELSEDTQKFLRLKKRDIPLVDQFVIRP